MKDVPMSVERIDAAAPAIAHPRWRRWFACCLVAAVVAAIAVLVLASWNPRRHLVLMPLAGRDPAVAVAAAGLVLLGFAVLLAVPPGRRRNIGAVALMSLTLPVWCAAGIAAELDMSGYDLHAPVAVAQSPDGRWQIVRRTYVAGRHSDAYYDEFRLRSRAGWLSREAPRPLAVIERYFSAGNVELDVVRIDFPGAHTVELFTNDGSAHTTSFDPSTLATGREFRMCGRSRCVNR
jgi:hypothetical protein